MAEPPADSNAVPWRFERLRLQSGLTMRVARAGTGPLLLMLHGFPECWYSWRHQIRAFCGSFECAAPDLRGYGETDAPVGVENYSIDKLVDDVEGLIAALGHERAIVVGHDWGGAIAWAVALQRPQMVERLVVMNCPHPLLFRTALRSNPRQMMRSWYMLLFQIPRLPEALIRARNFAVLRRMLRSSAVNKRAFTDADLDYYCEAFRRPYSMTAAINYYRALRRRDLMRSSASPHWLGRRIAVPTMLVWGEQDVALGKELTYGMDRLFSGPFQIRYIPDSGHWVQQERPETVNQYLRDFLSAGNI